MRTAKLLWLGIVILLLVILSGAIWFLTQSYNDIIHFTIDQLHRPDLLDVLQNRFFTADKFQVVRTISQGAIPLLLLGLLALILNRKNVYQFIHAILLPIKIGVRFCRQNIRTSSQTTKIILTTMIVFAAIRAVYYALHFYPQYDECWNYNYFLGNNFFTSFFAYNNYPLHNVITFGFLKLLPDTTFVMRMPNIILGLLNMLILYSISKKIFDDEKLALLAVAIFAVLPTTVFYMLFARGVMLSLFFGLLILHFFLLKKIGEWTLGEAFLIIIIGALGIFSMISFCFFVAIVYGHFTIVSIMKKDITAVKNIIICSVGVLVLGFILFLPMMMGSGLSLGLASEYNISSFSWGAYFESVQFVSRNQSGFYFLSYLFIVFNIIFISIHAHRNIAWLNFLLLLIPFIFPFLFKIYLPARAIGFQVFAYVFTLVILLEFVQQNTNFKTFIACSLVLVASLQLTTCHHTFLDWSAKSDKAAFEIAQIFKAKQITSYYDKSKVFQYFVPGILYHHKISGSDINFSTADSNSLRFLSLTDYEGNCFVDRKVDFEPSENKDILYEYTDVDPLNRDDNKDFILYQIR